MTDVTIYTRMMCGYCSAAKRLLDEKGVAVLDAVSAKLDTKALLDLDSQVQLDKKDPLDVAKAWLNSAGLD